MGAEQSNQQQHAAGPSARRARHFLVAAFAISVATFAVDVATPRGVAAGVFPHILAIALLAWCHDRRAPFALAALASLFSVLGYVLSEGGNPAIIITNRTFLVASYWVMALVVMLKQSADRGLRQSHARLESAFGNQAMRLESEIEHRRQTQESLQRAEIGLRLIIDRLPALIAYVDADGRYRFTNAYYDETLGRAPERPFAQHLSSVLKADDFAHATANIENALRWEVVKCAIDLPTPRGPRNFGATYVPDLDEDGAVRGFVLLALDVTEEQRLQQMLMQSQRLEAVGQLTGGIAHDFNNLLSVVIGRLELQIEALAADDPRRDELQKALDAADRGATLTRQLLAFSRQQPLQPRPLEPGRIVTGALDMLGRTLGEQIDIEIAAAPDLWLCEADPVQLETAIVNLALNARDAMPNGGRLTIEMANVELGDDYAAERSEVRPGSYVPISVSDNGIGMNEATRRRVFEPFFTNKEPGRGSGLGLAMVYGFVKQSGGHVSVYSEPGHGTSFKIYLPRAHDVSMRTPPARAGDGNLAGNGERILVVEDDGDIRKLAETLLGALDYRVVTASSGPEALDRLGNGHVDLLLTDLVLPGGMNGRQLAEAALALRPGLRVLYMSGYSENAVIHHGRLDPGVSPLQKPFRRNNLARAVKRVLGGEPA